jgi:hypothetical protein
MTAPRGASFWQPLVRLTLDGHSVASVARQHGVSHASLSYWKKKLDAEPPPALSFLPVHVASSHSVADLEISLDGVLLRCAVGTDPAYLAALVTALRAC